MLRLQRLGYVVTRQTGSHLRLTTEHNGVHHVTIPDHEAIRVGTLSAILADIATHHGLDRAALVNALFSQCAKSSVN